MQVTLNIEARAEPLGPWAELSFDCGGKTIPIASIPVNPKYPKSTEVTALEILARGIQEVIDNG